MDEGQDIGTCLKESSPGELELDEDMEMEEGSGGEDEEEEVGDPVSSPSPEQQMALGHGSSEQAVPSSSSFSQSLDDASTAPHKHFSGKPLSIRRGPGRPRKDKPASRASKKPIGLKLKRWKRPKYFSNVYVRGISKSPMLHKEESRDGASGTALDDGEHSRESPSPIEESQTTAQSTESEPAHGECSTSTTKPEKPVPPGKVCALCNLGERSQLGQGDLMRFSCPEGFTPHKASPSVERAEGELMSPSSETYPGDVVDRESVGSGDKSPRASSGPRHFYVHQSCAMWSSGVTRTEELVMENVGPAVLQASKRRCSYCSHYGATITCIVTNCSRILHFPCAAASGAFQDCKSVSMVCSQHLDQVPLLLSGEVTCVTCFALGDVSNLMMCTSCGHHFHGSCIGLALSAGSLKMIQKSCYAKNVTRRIIRSASVQLSQLSPNLGGSVNVVEYVVIAVLERLVPGCRLDGMPTILCVIRAINSVIKASRVHSVGEHIGLPPIEKWFSADSVENLSTDHVMQKRIFKHTTIKRN
ncbi:hypothetical protein C0J52_04797 [Blattella germanica]|nr:hypothetical protein C0J52_04797 [Blattella germanica]